MRTGLAVFLGLLGLVLVAETAFAQKAQVVLAWGKEGRKAGEFILPGSIAVDAAGNVFVTDNNDRIQKFNEFGGFITLFGGPGDGDGTVDTPSGIAVDANGDVYVADWLNNRVQKFSNGGAFVTGWGEQGDGDGQFLGPVSIDVDPSGVVYVVDQGNHRIQKFQSDGTFIEAWGNEGVAQGSLFWPRSVAISGNQVYVSDAMDRVQRFGVDGTFQLSFGISGSNLGELRNPVNIAIHPLTGDVYVADAGNHRVQQFDADGNHLDFWGRFDVGPNNPLPGTQLGNFNRPLDIAFQSGGDFFVADSKNNRIQRFSVGPVAVTPATWGELKTKFGN